MTKSADPTPSVGTVDKLVSKGSGLAKAAKAHVTGLVGVFQTLAKQHGEVGALLKRAKDDPSKQAELWPTIKMELWSHEQGEIREVYPVLREYGETRQLADLHDQDALELSDAIARLDALPLATPEWNDAFDQLTALVMQHVEEEENDIFPAAQKAMGQTRAEAIEPMFLKAKQAIALTA